MDTAPHTPRGEAPRALLLKEAAIELKVSTKTLWRWRRKGLIHISVTDKTARVPISEVDRVLGESAAPEGGTP